MARNFGRGQRVPRPASFGERDSRSGRVEFPLDARVAKSAPPSWTPALGVQWGRVIVKWRVTGALIYDPSDCFSHGRRAEIRSRPSSPRAPCPPRGTGPMMNRLVSVAHHRRGGAVGGGGRPRRPPPVPLRPRGQPFVRAQVVQRIARCVFPPAVAVSLCPRPCLSGAVFAVRPLSAPFHSNFAALINRRQRARKITVNTSASAANVFMRFPRHFPSSFEREAAVSHSFLVRYSFVSHSFLIRFKIQAPRENRRGSR